MSSDSPGDSLRENSSTAAESTTSIIQKTDISTINKSVDSSTNSRTRPLCKYFASKGSCPYGQKCRYRHTPTQQRICQHFLSSSCRYGNRCKFLHVKKEEPEQDDLSLLPVPSTQTHLLDVNSFPSLSSSSSTRPPPPVTTPPYVLTTPTSTTHSSTTAHSSTPPKKKGYERKGEEPLTLEDFIKRASNVKTRAPVARPKPTVSRLKVEGEGSELALRDIEIEQLKKRYPDHRLIEKSLDVITYSISYLPTDPDWVANKLPSFEIKVSLPHDYPRQRCKLSVVKGLPAECILVIDEALKKRTEEYYERNSSTGQYELILRPILNWLDRQLMTLIKGMTFLEDHMSKLDIKSNEEEEEEEEEEETDDEMATTIATTKDGYTPPVKRGTEIRLVGLELADNVGTVQVTSGRLTVECTRCKSHCDVLCKANKTSSQVCIRCNQIMALTFNSDLLHMANSSLAYLDLSNCKPVDLILTSCEGLLSCVECGREHSLKGWSFGQPLAMSCHGCHIPLSVSATQCRFIIHQTGQVSLLTADMIQQQQSLIKKKKPSDIIEGRPLPDTGTCQHYKKSHRWLRFPCCGKAFPCDVCHDTTEDHVMERANRMICGYCSKEQVYNGTKPCNGCGSDMTQSRTSSHWEGGQGCRNKVKMGRNDRQKFLNSDKKTSSMKSERVGVKGRNNVISQKNN